MSDGKGSHILLELSESKQESPLPLDEADRNHALPNIIQCPEAHPHGQRSLCSFLVLSNASIFVASLAALLTGWYTHAFVYACAAVVAVTFHKSRETKLEETDTVLDYATLLCNLTKWWETKAVLTGILLLLSLIIRAACLFRKPNYNDRFHSWWHIYIGITSTLLYSPY